MIAGAFLSRAALSRPGLVALTALVLVAFYEGAPIAPLDRVPLLGPVLAVVTSGRVERASAAAAREARQGYVREAEKSAAEAALAETRRQLRVATDARERFATALAQTRAATSARLETLEAEISDYETRLALQGRICRLDRGDIDWLRID
ncbi:hypothetical protein [Mesorhizobium sp. CAU 1732]|uniref:hypothetical protein n=1 Tax=Mesorhizobium sp. CAU 1732 TaxID=3140358 RepID=UPI003261B1EF